MNGPAPGREAAFRWIVAAGVGLAGPCPGCPGPNNTGLAADGSSRAPLPPGRGAAEGDGPRHPRPASRSAAPPLDAASRGGPRPLTAAYNSRMSLPAEFLANVIHSPLEDAPRLVAADWLDENGDPARAEFVRLQIELERTPKPDPPEARGQLKSWQRQRLAERQAREAWLLDWHAHEWLFDLPPGLRPVLPGATRGTFRRGFVERIELPAAEFLRHARGLALAAPITEVRLTGKAPARLNDSGSDKPFGWYDQDLLDGAFPGEGPHEYGLPRKIFDLLPDPILNYNERPAGLNRYKTSDESVEVLARALVNHARDLAGLPAVRWPVPTPA